jgi:hypothetical protein
MKSTVLVGCEAIDAGADFVRLREPSGSLRTIPWSSIRSAATLNNEHMTFQGDLSPITELSKTHEVLFIMAGETVDFVMMEKGSGQTESVLATFREHLGARWLGDQFAAADAVQLLFQMPTPMGKGMPKVVIIAIAGMILIFALALIVAKLGH